MQNNVSKKLASTVAFICSGEASFITGDIIPIDGGTHNFSSQLEEYKNLFIS